MTKIDDFEKRLGRLRGGRDIWIPFWLSEVGTAEEIEEWKNIRRREIAELNHQPVVGSDAGRMQQVIDSEKRSREFERRMRAKYGSRMPETNSEALERDLRDPPRERSPRGDEGRPSYPKTSRAAESEE